MPDESKTPMTGRKAKGPNPHFFDDPNTDRLLTMIMEMASELSVMRDRLDTHERLAAERNLYSPEDIESYVVSDDAMAAREAWRNKFLDRLLAGLYAEYDERGSKSPAGD